MKEQFVTYEITIKLKEKGFDEPCFGLYNIYETYGQYGIINIGDLHLTNVNRGFKGNNAIIAPLWQQVIDWLLETHKLYITITSCSQESWQFHIQKPGETLNTLWKEDFYSYREARQAAIEHALTLI